MWDWLTSEAGAAWIALLCTACATIAMFVIRRARRSIVVMEEYVSSFVDISSTMRSRLTVLYDDRPVRSLEQLVVTVANHSAATVTSPTVYISLPKATSVLAAVSDDPDVDVQVRDDRVAVTPRFMNTYRHQGHAPQVAILVDGTVAGWLAGGRGPGWFARRSRTTRARLTKLRVVAAMLAGTIGLSLVHELTILSDASWWRYAYAPLFFAVLLVPMFIGEGIDRRRVYLTLEDVDEDESSAATRHAA
jgi:hypothetical protein